MTRQIGEPPGRCSLAMSPTFGVPQCTTWRSSEASTWSNRTMAQRGRKPKPVAAKLAAGNPGKRPLTTLVPSPASGEMLCPTVVQRNPRARAYWQMFLANAAPGHLSPIDGPLLARLCVALAYADEANEKLEDLGLLIKAPRSEER